MTLATSIANVVTMGYSTGDAGFPDNVNLIPTLGYGIGEALVIGHSSSPFRNQVGPVKPFPEGVRPKSIWQVRRETFEKLALDAKESIEKERKLRKGRATKKVDKELLEAIEDAEALIAENESPNEDMNERLAQNEAISLALADFNDKLERRAEEAAAMMGNITEMLDRSREIQESKKRWAEIQRLAEIERKRIEDMIRADTEAITIIMVIV